MFTCVAGILWQFASTQEWWVYLIIFGILGTVFAFAIIVVLGGGGSISGTVIWVTLNFEEVEATYLEIIAWLEETWNWLINDLWNEIIAWFDGAG